MPRFTVQCIFCGGKNTKRSPQGRTFKCTHCGEVNFGPGMGRVLAKMVEASLPGFRGPGRPKKTEQIPAALPVAGQTTVIKAAKASPSTPAAKPAPKAKPPVAPAAVKPEPKPSLIERVASRVYG